MTLYPLKFKPILKERLWGGSKLKTVLQKAITTDITGESWELSGVEGDVSIVSNGAWAGTSLTELIAQYGAELLGKSVIERFGSEFPILIKFIDAQQDLSIQVHPNDSLAQKRHKSFGKTEMWYIMDAEEDSSLIVGFNKTVSKETYRTSLKNNTLTQLLHYEKVKEGDTFFINTGKIHAIGAGILLAEIQQTSDITYRVFDFNRKDKDGNLRELHTDLALDAIDFEYKNDFKIGYEETKDRPTTLVSCPYFITNFIHISQDMRLDVSKRDSFTIYMCVAGKVHIGDGEHEVQIKKGETVLIPAITQTIFLKADSAKLLEVTV
ncbi:type I phosphomannose isomerase catalytic subunit [Arenibacter sp. GZD96]|uniref:type I phosphomannose isomerase catalytic subunit n=1 Tax=Aurantibrevibacter litoralis TaxID=3106030 RepID=UPI002AFDD6F4|nr:type I phosphomannose isomerase catalytic subunit [Arenibacter sp. GZD-96]MEA1787528.1 type I phosphomannose isomerase catalytic subunit [Arenibacter sp. GZD-96]